MEEPFFTHTFAEERKAQDEEYALALAMDQKLEDEDHKRGLELTTELSMAEAPVAHLPSVETTSNESDVLPDVAQLRKYRLARFDVPSHGCTQAVRRCSAMTLLNKPCRLWPIAGTTRCHIHTAIQDCSPCPASIS